MSEAVYSPVGAPDNRARFGQLQRQLREHSQILDPQHAGNCDILVIPSLTLDQEELTKIKGVHYYEERLLFLLMRLQNPRTRLVYLTSQPIHPSIIDYYLELLHGVPFSHARDRLLLLSVYDTSPRSLTAKVLERPRLLGRIRQAMQTDHAYMVSFNSTELERQLAVTLNLPLFGLDPDLLHWGTKSGSRMIFAESQVPHPDGSPLVCDVSELAAQVAALWARQPDLQRIVIKLDEGFSGQGNAVSSLAPLQQVAPAIASPAECTAAIAQAFEQLSFQSETECWPHFAQRIREMGAIAEAFVEGEGKRSPSVQGRILPDGTVEIWY